MAKLASPTFPNLHVHHALRTRHPAPFSRVFTASPLPELHSTRCYTHTHTSTHRRRHRPFVPVATSSSSSSPLSLPKQHDTYIKVCGVTNVEDAVLAASNGAHLVGMILWPHAKRSISPSTALQISNAIRPYGASPVAVFVDEDAERIGDVCRESSIAIAQLHGDGARAALPYLSSTSTPNNTPLQTIYVMHADEQGVLQTPVPPCPVDFVLVDGMQGGSGERFEWSSLSSNPKLQQAIHATRCGWLLAGGLSPENVGEAITIAHPTGVDVSSGVCGPDGLKKDAPKVVDYIQNATHAFQHHSTSLSSL